MAATRTAAGLSGADVEQIRAALASGRKPKVVFTSTAGQIAGQTGQVVSLTDPVTSEEWIVVRFGRDELPFSPADMALPTRGAARKADPPPEPEFRLGTPAPLPRGRGSGVRPGNRPPTTAEPPKVEPSKVVRPAKVKAPASLTVTLSYADREWTVAAVQGTRTLAKPYVIKPADALRMVSLIDVTGVHDAVENIIAAERAEAETRAQRLRAELAEIEARLTELTDGA